MSQKHEIFVTISEHSSIINNVLNPCASSLNHSCYAHIEVCDNTVTHIQWKPPNFLTNVCLHSLYCLRIVSLLGGFLPGKSLLNCRWVRTTDFVAKYASTIFPFSCTVYQVVGSMDALGWKSKALSMIYLKMREIC